MIRKGLIVGILGLGIVMGGMQPGTRQRIAASAKNFRQSFRDLKMAGDSLSPLERFVFSVLLASTNTPQGGAPAAGE
jgi:hypothetical protein